MDPLNRRAVLGAAGLLALMVAGRAHANFMDKLKGSVDQVTGGAPGGGAAGSALGTDKIVAGLKEALRVGAERVVGQLGAADGFNADPKIHIPLPPSLQKVQAMLGKVGMSGLADDVELKINRAAEEATPKTKEILWKAVNGMTVDDAKKIYDGPSDAATQYFKKIATPDLKAAVAPIIDRSLQSVGAIGAYDKMIGQYKSIPLVPDVKADLKAHATDGALNGIFHYLAREEASIRANPSARTTDLLKQVFGKS